MLEICLDVKNNTLILLIVIQKIIKSKVLIKRFVGGSENFKRDLASYEKGFGDQNRDFWLGKKVNFFILK